MDPSNRAADDRDGAGESREDEQLGTPAPVPAPSSRRRGSGGEISESIDGVLGGDEELMRLLRALDLQVVGACRADERLKPLLKINVSSGPAEDRLIAQISQHFEVSEVGMLARCLFIPLVSIRVGKVIKQGNLLCPVATRGHLNLSLLPSSKMRISFIGDDGCTERLALLNHNSSYSDVTIAEITADDSGRCFLVKLPNNQVLYYWCSERSRSLGTELIVKMKGLLQSKPSLSDLTGISQSRLVSFVTHLQAYVFGCTNSTTISTFSSNDLLGGANENEIDYQPSCIDSTFSYSPVTSSQTGKVHFSCNDSLSPGLEFFKNGIPRTRKETRDDELKPCQDGLLSSASIDTDFVSSLPSSSSFSGASSISTQEDEKWGDTEPFHGLYCPDIPSLSTPLLLFNPLSAHLSSPELCVPTAEFSPHYCWCPLPSSLQHSVDASCQTVGSFDSLPLPSLSALLSDASPSVSSLPSRLPIDFAELRALALPAFHPDPIFPIPLSVSSITLPTSQQIPTFTPFLSDPIVHIPVIDICSSGQGYLVSGGPAISSVISPLQPVHVNQLIPKSESAMEKSARETLEMLIASTPAPFSSHLSNTLPNVLDNMKKLTSADVNRFDTTFSSQFSFGNAVGIDAPKSGYHKSKPEECNDENKCDGELGTPENANK